MRIPENLKDKQLEMSFLSAMFCNPTYFHEISSQINDKDFSDEKISALFSVMREMVMENEAMEPTLVFRRMKDYGHVSDTPERLMSVLTGFQKSEKKPESLISIGRSLLKLSFRRRAYEALENAKSYIETEANEKDSYDDMLGKIDNLVYSFQSTYENKNEQPVDIYEYAKQVVEERALHPIDSLGPLGPHKRLNQIYGSLFIPGGICVIMARTKMGKSTWATHNLMAIRELNPTYHCLLLDNGEMSRDETAFRLVSAVSGVPMHLIQTGKWLRTDKDTVKKVRQVWKDFENKKLRADYLSVGKKGSEELMQWIKRYYYNKVGRNNPLLISYDYIKDPGSDKYQASHEKVGKFLNDLKLLIQEGVLNDDGLPCISLCTYIQENRTGITKGKRANDIVDSEDSIGLSDKVSQYCTQLFRLRRKTEEEVQIHGKEFGTHMMTCLLPRSLGEDTKGHFESVKIGDHIRQNWLNFNFDNFDIRECGDGFDVSRAASMGRSEVLDLSPTLKEDEEDLIP